MVYHVPVRPDKGSVCDVSSEEKVSRRRADVQHAGSDDAMCACVALVGIETELPESWAASSPLPPALAAKSSTASCCRPAAVQVYEAIPLQLHTLHDPDSETNFSEKIPTRFLV